MNDGANGEQDRLDEPASRGLWKELPSCIVGEIIGACIGAVLLAGVVALASSNFFPAGMWTAMFWLLAAALACTVLYYVYSKIRAFGRRDS